MMRIPPLPSQLYWGLAVSLALSLVPGGKYALYPFRLFTTWAHECCHAAAALLVGGKVERILIHPDTSGVTRYRVPPGRLRVAIVTSAGYPGASLLGGLLLAIGVTGLSFPFRPSLLEVLTLGLGTLMCLSALVWVRNFFGFAMVLLMGGLLIAASRQPVWLSAYVTLGLLWVGLQTSLNALLDIRVLFGLERQSGSDAELMSKILVLPAWVWAGAWLGMSCGVTLFALSAPLRWGRFVHFINHSGLF